MRDQPAGSVTGDRPGVVEALLGILREALQSDAVQPEDDLFDLGVDSLVIVKTAARVRERLGVDPPLSAYFDAGTVAELARTVSGAPPLPEAAAPPEQEALPAGGAPAAGEAG
jgi:acyl carrier protein